MSFGRTKPPQVLFASLLDSFHARFIPYGARAAPAQASARQPAETSSRSVVTRALDVVASWKVPHRYFTHFYIASVVASVFWAVQVTLRGGAFEAIATRVSPEHRDRSMSITQIVMCWGLMLVQGGRRLYECFAFYKPSSSSMWFAHWLVGLAFYLLMSVSIWIEGTGMLLSDFVLFCYSMKEATSIDLEQVRCCLIRSRWMTSRWPMRRLCAPSYVFRSC